MNPELQTLVDRIELLERQTRSMRLLAMLALLGAVLAGAAAWTVASRAPSAPGDRARFSVVEANRFIVRDLDGAAAGGLDVDGNGTIRLVLGRANVTGAATLEAQRNGVAHLSLKGPDGAVLAALVGTRRPSLALGIRPGGPSATLSTRDDGAGAIALYDASGGLRFRAP